MERILALTDHEGLCWKCLKDKSNIHKIYIPEMGYGSAFDNESTEIHLCDDCYKESIKHNQDLWSMEERHDLFGEGFGEDYKYENEMLEYISSLPIQGKQFVQNEFSSDGYYMDAQDWIDYKLDILPHEKCKEYGMYSPQEIKSYEDRFSTCEYPTNRIFSDNSKACYCPFGASGEYGQIASENISTECYKCKYYIKRITPIKDIQTDKFSNEFGDYMEYLRMNIRQDELRRKFE